ncbi:hypothetical protein ACP4OV_003019 [Aristida adscensionis]
MADCSKNKQHQQEEADAGRRAGRPHWRRRDPAATAVYVVHPAQFRTVVQQLTGGAPSPPSAASQSHQPAGTGAAASGNAAAAQAQQQHGGGGGGRQRTLGQMHEDCLAWANADDDDF